MKNTLPVKNYYLFYEITFFRYVSSKANVLVLTTKQKTKESTVKL